MEEGRLLFQTHKPKLLFVRPAEKTEFDFFLVGQANPRMERFTKSLTVEFGLQLQMFYKKREVHSVFKGKIEGWLTPTLCCLYNVSNVDVFAITHPVIGKRWPIPKVTFALPNFKEILHKNRIDRLLISSAPLLARLPS